MPRPKKPKQIKEIQGTLRPSRELSNPMEVESLSTIPAAPDGLDKVGQDTWYSTASKLQELGLLSDLDLVMLKEYCYQVSIMQKAKKCIDEEGMTIIMQNKGGGMYPVKSPYIAIYNEALTHSCRIAQQFGFTPSSRQSISLPQQKKGGKLTSLIKKN
jgi:P27 family predicted phage terminase small subunit